VKDAKAKGRHADIARYLDHAFGKVQVEQDADPDPSAALADMTPAQRAAHRDVVMRELAAMEAAMEDRPSTSGVDVQAAAYERAASREG